MHNRTTLTCCRDGKWPFNGLQFLCRDEARMCHISSIDGTLLQETHNVFSSKAVSNSTNLLGSVFALQLFKGFRNDGVHGVSLMRLHPLHDVEVCWAIEGNWVPVEKIWHQNKIPIGSELVSNKLRVVEAVADDIRNEQDCFLSRLILGVGDVGLNCDCDQLAIHDSWTYTLLPGVTNKETLHLQSPILIISPTASPSCLTPMVQHRPGGFDAIMLDVQLKYQIESRKQMSLCKGTEQLRAWNFNWKKRRRLCSAEEGQRTAISTPLSPHRI
jgi:hypothetical protein